MSFILPRMKSEVTKRPSFANFFSMSVWETGGFIPYEKIIYSDTPLFNCPRLKLYVPAYMK